MPNLSEAKAAVDNPASELPWMEPLRWDACDDPNLDLESLASLPCWVGLEADQRHGIMAAVLIFRGAGDHCAAIVATFPLLPNVAKMIAILLEPLRVSEIVHDPWNCTMYLQGCSEITIHHAPSGSALRARARDLLMTLVQQQRFHHGRQASLTTPLCNLFLNEHGVLRLPDCLRANISAAPVHALLLAFSSAYITEITATPSKAPPAYMQGSDTPQPEASPSATSDAS